MVAVISVDAYHFLAFSDLTYHLEDTGIGVFCYTVPPDSNQTELGSSNQEASSSAGKHSRVILLPCCTWECVPTAISGCMGISKILGVSFVTTDEFSVRVTKNYFQGLVSHELTVYLSVFEMTILSKRRKPDNFESHNTLKLSFTNIRGFHSNFFDCESFLELNSPDIRALSETNLDDSTDLAIFLLGFSPFNLKGFSYSYGLSSSLCERRTSVCLVLISRKIYGFLLKCLTGFTSFSV